MCERMKGALQAAMICVLGFHASAQGTFQNLDFEEANPVIIQGSQYNDATAASALPYWTATIGGVVQSEIPVNESSTGAPWVSLIGPGSQSGFSPIDGSYSLLLQGAASAVAISQTGLIPSGTQSLLFKTQTMPALQFGPFDVQVGNQTMQAIQVGTGPNYLLYGVNISAWAGQTEQISLIDPQYSWSWELDDISFSPTAVTPEPSPLASTGIGGLLFAFFGCGRFMKAEHSS
jgi:hypothetical protein